MKSDFFITVVLSLLGSSALRGGRIFSHGGRFHMVADLTKCGG